MAAIPNNAGTSQSSLFSGAAGLPTEQLARSV